MFKIVLSSLVILISSFTTVSMAVEANDDLLQTKNRDIKFKEFMRVLDLGASNLVFSYKSGSTSVGLKFIIDDDYKAYWLPNENGAANSQGQVVSYYLGRFLKMSELVLPSDYLYLKGSDLVKFEALLVANYKSERGKWKLENRDHVLRKVRSNIKANKAHLGAISIKKKKFTIDRLVKSNSLNSSHILAKMIKAGGPIPSKEKIMGLREVKLLTDQVNTATEYSLAKDLSRIMVLDMLVGQWDRFSGGNLEARFDKDKENPGRGQIRFFARDNGGASVSSKTPVSSHFRRTRDVVSRFDRKQIVKLRELQTLLSADPELVQATLRMKSSTGSLSARVKAVLEHVESQITKYGEEKAYFN